MKEKSAIIPYRIVDNQLEILLVKNSSNTKWVIPKGSIEESLKPAISATKEAYEEAGVLGVPIPILVGTYNKNGQEVPTYLLNVLVELEHYEEDSKRKRSWHKLKELDESICDKDLLELTKVAALLIDLMLDNTTSKMGYWSLKDMEKGFVFTRMYNEELHILTSDSLEVIFDLLSEKCLSMTEVHT